MRLRIGVDVLNGGLGDTASRCGCFERSAG